eukprot:TRINITY_DN12731_c0_g1_i1.p2 TRINITY_DN12731_c0_g1~~TRINITY_DN12731_c0_g1_i1.p2  ORF type:complete len:154 (-),score=22.22 TRINITY_DN12731_c0_g1_i1:223-624(-)
MFVQQLSQTQRMALIQQSKKQLTPFLSQFQRNFCFGKEDDDEYWEKQHKKQQQQGGQQTHLEEPSPFLGISAMVFGAMGAAGVAGIGAYMTFYLAVSVARGAAAVKNNNNNNDNNDNNQLPREIISNSDSIQK